MRKLKLSVVIPTLNEEKYLPLLLESIKRNNFKECEVIVADVNSTDRTREIAKEYGAKVVQGGPHPGIGRNRGAKYAKGKYIIFSDSDVIFSDDFLKNTYNEMEERGLKISVPDLYPLSNRFIYKFHKRFENFWIRVLSYTWHPLAYGSLMIIERELYEKSFGFDESIVFAEDAEFLKRYSKMGKYKVLDSTHAMISMRRHDKEGHLRYIIKGWLNGMLRVMGMEDRNHLFNYEWAKYDSKRTLKKRFADIRNGFSDIWKDIKKKRSIKGIFMRIFRILLG